MGPFTGRAARKFWRSAASFGPAEVAVRSARPLSRTAGGGRLPAHYIIHTVGPVWNGGHKGEPELLANCYRHSLAIALDHQLESVAFPGISTGIYHYPKQEAAALAVREWPREVVLVAFDAETKELYEQEVTRTL